MVSKHKPTPFCFPLLYLPIAPACGEEESDGDLNGDIKGAEERLEEVAPALAKLGVSIFWNAPAIVCGGEEYLLDGELLVSLDEASLLLFLDIIGDRDCRWECR